MIIKYNRQTLTCPVSAIPVFCAPGHRKCDTKCVEDEARKALYLLRTLMSSPQQSINLRLQAKLRLAASRLNYSAILLSMSTRALSHYGCLHDYYQSKLTKCGKRNGWEDGEQGYCDCQRLKHKRTNKSNSWGWNIFEAGRIKEEELETWQGFGSWKCQIFKTGLSIKKKWDIDFVIAHSPK